MDPTVPEVVRHGPGADLARLEALGHQRVVPLELARVGAEVEPSAVGEPARRQPHEARPVAVHGEAVGLHALGVREGGRVEHDVVVPLARGGAGLEELQAVRVHQPVRAPVHREAVELEVAARPVLVRPRHVHRGGRGRAARARVDGEAPRVGEQVEDALPRRVVPDDRARLAVVEEEPRVEVVAQVHLEPQALLLHRAHDAAVVHAVVLLGAVLDAPAVLHVEPRAGHLQAVEDLLLAAVLEGAHLLGRLVARAAVDPRHHVAVVPVDDRGELGDVALVEAEAGDAARLRPAAQVPQLLRQSVAQHARARAVSGPRPPGARPARGRTRGPSAPTTRPRARRAPAAGSGA